MSEKSRIGILLSGRGSNFLAIADAIMGERLTGAEIAVVISNRADALGIKAARSMGFVAEVIEPLSMSRSQYDLKVLASLRKHKVDLVCLAGYLRILTEDLVHAFPQRILNIHPSLLPAFPGLDAQRQALQFGVSIAGCTVHFVDEQVDHGVIVLQKSVPVKPEDDEQSLAARILAQEHQAYPEAITRVLSGKYHFAGRRYLPTAGQSTLSPLQKPL